MRPPAQIMITVMIVHSLLSVAVADDSSGPMSRFQPLIGEWKGEATIFKPRNEGEATLTETVEAVCAKILEGSYVECRTNWSRSDGRRRAHHGYINYNESEQAFQQLFLFRGWSGQLKYSFTWDEKAQMFVGFHDDEVGDRPARVRAEFGFRNGGKEHWAREYNHIDGEAEGYWPQTFEMKWTKQ